jgi:hypothetical protein
VDVKLYNKLEHEEKLYNKLVGKNSFFWTMSMSVCQRQFVNNKSVPWFGQFN